MDQETPIYGHFVIFAYTSYLRFSILNRDAASWLPSPLSPIVYHGVIMLTHRFETDSTSVRAHYAQKLRRKVKDEACLGSSVPFAGG